jgi:hypothetical protein
MPIETVWGDDNHSIIEAHFIGDWTWDEYHASDKLVAEMAAGTNYRIDIITDLSRSNGIPEGNLMANIGRGHNLEIPNLGIIVTVQLPRIVEALRPMVTKITGRENRFSVSSLEAAYTIIAQSRLLDNPNT